MEDTQNSMLNQIKSLIHEGRINKNELLNLLQKYAKDITIADFIECNLQLREDAECIHTSYKEDLIESYTIFMLRIKDVREDTSNYNEEIDASELIEAVDILLEQDKSVEEFEFGMAFWKIYKILSIYSTFIMEEPIHQVGMMFPGGFTVKKVGNKYTCPVKENNKDNHLAVCPFCIAEQDETV